jgi:predicted chitinase
MDGKTLMAAMTYPGYTPRLTLDRYEALAGPCTKALRQAHCGTAKRISVFLAQIGAETGSLYYTEEIADGSAYEGRADLGNYEPGDGHRFKGRSFIQITGRAHYSNLSIWAHAKGYVPTRTYFVDHPERLAADRYAFLGPVWYWTVARPGLNRLADNDDIAGATYAVNGGYNNLSGRRARWEKCLTLGDALLPSHTTDSGTTHSLPKAGSMAGEYVIIRQAGTKSWYAWAPGYWFHFQTAAQLRAAAGTRLCANGKDARKAIANPAKSSPCDHSASGVATLKTLSGVA